MTKRRAFTLIELLVVIAIILFPVFAQAKFAAKKTSDLNNLKQSAIATVMYATDVDDRFPMIGYFEVDGDWNTHHLWTKDIQPYEKSLNLLRDPVEPDNLWYDAWSKPNPSIQYRYPTYGFNADYLNPAGDASCGDYMENGWYWGPPISTTQPAQPSGTVLFAATRLNMTNSTEYADSPALATDPTVCDVWGDGWGGNPGRAGTATTYTGHVSPRYAGGLNVAFTDSSAKYMKAGRLAAGTNWNPAVTKDPSQVLITDRSQYLWDTQ